MVENCRESFIYQQSAGSGLGIASNASVPFLNLRVKPLLTHKLGLMPNGWKLQRVIFE